MQKTFTHEGNYLVTNIHTYILFKNNIIDYNINITYLNQRSLCIITVSL